MAAAECTCAISAALPLPADQPRRWCPACDSARADRRHRRGRQRPTRHRRRDDPWAVLLAPRAGGPSWAERMRAGALRAEGMRRLAAQGLTPAQAAALLGSARGRAMLAHLLDSTAAADRCRTRLALTMPQLLLREHLPPADDTGTDTAGAQQQPAWAALAAGPPAPAPPPVRLLVSPLTAAPAAPPASAGVLAAA